MMDSVTVTSPKVFNLLPMEEPLPLFLSTQDRIDWFTGRYKFGGDVGGVMMALDQNPLHFSFVASDGRTAREIKAANPEYAGAEYEVGFMYGLSESRLLQAMTRGLSVPSPWLDVLSEKAFQAHT